jgi:hypothetical protein
MTSLPPFPFLFSNFLSPTQILASRSEKRQLGSRKGNTFSVATFGEAAPDTDAGE